jgi:hypothetical protein
MPLTEPQKRLAQKIDKHVHRILANGGDDEDLLVSMYDHMPTFKQLLDTCTKAEMNALCERYDGFYRPDPVRLKGTGSGLLELLAEGIADGSIPVPK